MKLFATIFFAITINSCSAWISFFENYIIYILQNSNNYDRTIYQCRAYGASFGGVLSDGRLTGCLIPTVPPDACSTVARPPSFNSTITCHSPIALIIRGNCSFALKVLNAQKANYKSAVIYNDVLDPTIDVMYDDEAQSGTEIYIPSFLVNNHCGRELFNRYTVQKGNYIIQIKTIWTDYDIVRYLLPFVAVVGLCFFAMVISMMLKLVRDRRRHMRRRLTTQSLKKIPIKKYKKYDIPETCAICLEDFIEGEKLRVLPCSHWYHVNCIDPWLTRSRKDCPICKRRVNPEHPETSDSETDDSAERRPLLQTSNGNRNGFTRNYNTADAVPVHVSDGPSLEQNLEPAQPIGRVSGAVNNAFLDEIPSSSRNN